MSTDAATLLCDDDILYRAAFLGDSTGGLTGARLPSNHPACLPG